MRQLSSMKHPEQPRSAHGGSQAWQCIRRVTAQRAERGTWVGGTDMGVAPALLPGGTAARRNQASMARDFINPRMRHLLRGGSVACLHSPLSLTTSGSPGKVQNKSWHDIPAIKDKWAQACQWPGGPILSPNLNGTFERKHTVTRSCFVLPSPAITPSVARAGLYVGGDPTAVSCLMLTIVSTTIYFTVFARLRGKFIQAWHSRYSYLTHSHTETLPRLNTTTRTKQTFHVPVHKYPTVCILLCISILRVAHNNIALLFSPWLRLACKNVTTVDFLAAS